LSHKIGKYFSDLIENKFLKKLHLKFKILFISEIMIKDMFISLNSKIESLVLSNVKLRYNNENKDKSDKLDFLNSLSFLKELTLEKIDNISNKDIFELSHHLISLKSIRIISCQLLSEECVDYFINCENKSFIRWEEEEDSD
jgi:hypothetical protein